MMESLKATHCMTTCCVILIFSPGAACVKTTDGLGYCCAGSLITIGSLTTCGGFSWPTSVCGGATSSPTPTPTPTPNPNPKSSSGFFQLMLSPVKMITFATLVTFLATWFSQA